VTPATSAVATTTPFSYQQAASAARAAGAAAIAAAKARAAGFTEEARIAKLRRPAP
jgi:hypothetical protein